LNPLELIRKLCRPEDLVVFKLDVDSEKVEVGLMEQLLADPTLLELVDEFYFEVGFFPESTPLNTFTHVQAHEPFPLPLPPE
jgi:hypothetical protein